jgi:hypothetical protein
MIPFVCPVHIPVLNGAATQAEAIKVLPSHHAVLHVLQNGAYISTLYFPLAMH